MGNVVALRDPEFPQVRAISMPSGTYLNAADVTRYLRHFRDNVTPPDADPEPYELVLEAIAVCADVVGRLGTCELSG